VATGLTRRQFVNGGAAAGAAMLASNELIARALANPPRCGRLQDIEHVVILIQENRAFDHYFGSYPGVSGFADPNALLLNDGSGLTVFAHPGYPGGYDGGHLYPFHLDSFNNGECRTTSTTAGALSTPTGTGAR
jgi:phospholipase C